MGQIYLVRHGQASFGTANYDQLSSLGAEQGRLLGVWFAECGHSFDHVVTGALHRHRQTADSFLDAMGAMPSRTVDPGFNEYDHEEILIRHRPDFADPEAVKRFLVEHENGKKAFQKIFEDAMARWMSGEHDADYGESWAAFRARCVAALSRLVDGAGASQRIVVFTSGGTISTLCQHVLGMSDRQTFQLNWSLVNSAVTKFLFQAGTGGEDSRISMSYLNNFAHLEKTGDNAIVTYR
ncbi:MAG TPA: histidine phosphatase family protein [Burkholderiaceae bacterium]